MPRIGPHLHTKNGTKAPLIDQLKEDDFPVGDACPRAISTSNDPTR